MERRDVVYVQITLVAGRPRELKLGLYRQITANLTNVGMRPEDVFITLTENALDNWSAGNGRAQLVDLGAVAGARIEP